MPTYLTPGVYVEEVPSGSMPLSAAATAVPAFVGFTAKAPTDDFEDDPHGIKPRMVTNWSQYTKLYGSFTNSAMMPQAVYGYFQNGGGRCWIVRIPHREHAHESLMALAAGGDEQTEPPGPALHVVSVDEEKPLEVKITPNEPPADKPNAKPTFNIQVSRDGEVKESYADLSLGKGGKSVVAEVNGSSTLIEVVSVLEDDDLAIEEKEFTLAAPVRAGEQGTELAKIDNKGPFEGDAAKRHGVEGLAIADEVTMVAIPDLYTAAVAAAGDGEKYNTDLWKGVQEVLLAHCKNERRMAILDTPPELNAQQVREWSDGAGFDNMFGTLYYPWLKVDNPVGKNGNKTIHVPPCGHMAGIWSRTDETRGVWKAPANEAVMGVLDVQEKITRLEQELLNPEGINAIRSFGSRGLKVWGARTLSKTDQSWRYINVRRLFNMIETSIMDGTQWVVFEPNDQALWQRVNRTVSSFLLGLWRDGALFGATPEEAFFVKCDSETNPPESIDEGKLIVEVGIAPVKPAEFVIFRISQKALASTG